MRVRIRSPFASVLDSPDTERRLRSHGESGLDSYYPQRQVCERALGGKFFAPARATGYGPALDDRMNDGAA